MNNLKKFSQKSLDKKSNFNRIKQNIPPKCKDCFKIFKTVKDLRHLIDCKLIGNYRF